MLKKVAGAAPHLKDKLKHRLNHHGHAPPSSGSSRYGSRYHSTHGGGKKTAMSFSTVDNDAFEQILDDDSDFMPVANSPPTRPPAPKRSGVSQPSGVSSSTLENPHSDLFDTDIFDRGVVYDDDGDDNELLMASGEDSSPPEGSQAMVNYDPLSGQIVSQPVTSSGSDEDSGGLENRNGTEMHHTDGMGGDENGTGIGGDHRAADSRVEDSKLEQTELKSETVQENLDGKGYMDGVEGELDGVLATSNEPEVQSTKLESEEKDLEPDYLFDEVPEPAGNEPTGNAQQLVPEGSIKPELTLAENGQPPSAGDLVGTEAEPREFSKPQGAPDMPRAYESPVSSVPSSVEADSYLQGSAARELEFPVKHPASGMEQSHDQASGVGSSSHPLVGVHQQGEVRSYAESSGTSLEAQLEELLAPRSKGGSEGSPLDSGVYENERREVDVTPESDGIAISAFHTDGDELLIHDDHFTRPKDRSSSVPVFCTPPSSKAPNQGKRNSSGKTPPPRPPLSPRVKKRMLKSAHSAGHVTGSVEDRVVPELVKPLGSAKVVDSQARKLDHGSSRARKEEVGEVDELSDDDELFPDDTKKVRETDVLKRPISSTHSSHEQAQPASQSFNTAAPKESEGTCTSLEQPEVRQESEFALSVQFHLLFSLVLYLYYSLNIFPYVAGLFAGFLMLYLFLGSVFVYYVQTIEKELVERQQEKRKEAVQVSEDFVQTMKVDFLKLKEYQVSCGEC